MANSSFFVHLTNLGEVSSIEWPEIINLSRCYSLLPPPSVSYLDDQEQAEKERAKGRVLYADRERDVMLKYARAAILSQRHDQVAYERSRRKTLKPTKHDFATKSSSPRTSHWLESHQVWSYLSNKEKRGAKKHDWTVGEISPCYFSWYAYLASDKNVLDTRSGRNVLECIESLTSAPLMFGTSATELRQDALTAPNQLRNNFKTESGKLYKKRIILTASAAKKCGFRTFDSSTRSSHSYGSEFTPGLSLEDPESSVVSREPDELPP